MLKTNILVLTLFLIVIENVAAFDEYSFVCDNAQKINLVDICNGAANCTDGSDEVIELCKNIKFGKIECRGLYIEIREFCESHVSCQDVAVFDYICNRIACPDHTFQCKYGECIDSNLVCDKFYNCIDGSDEDEDLCNLANEKTYITCPPVESSKTFSRCFNNGILPCHSPLPVGTLVQSDCKPYYRAENNNYEITCLPNGTWSNQPLSCKADCGQNQPIVNPLILHGVTAKEGKWPWHASIYQKNTEEWKFSCGATLISENAVLTAAHCVWKIPSQFLRVVLGKQYNDFNIVDHYTQIRDVKKLVLQPLYLDFYGNYGSDIAIIFLNESVELTHFVRPVCLESQLYDVTEKVTEESVGVVVGMGITENDTVSEVLREIYLPTVSYPDCITHLQPDFRKYVTFTTFCAGTDNGGAVCNGDSGGGLVFQHPNEDYRWIIEGVVSISPRKRNSLSCDPKYYTVFTKVGLYVNWIRSMLAAHE